jgi:hypothetical protein
MSTHSETRREEMDDHPRHGPGGGRSGAYPDDDGRRDRHYSESFFSRYGKKIAGSIACSLLVYVVMHLPYIKVIILWICQIVILIFGRPSGADRLEGIENKVVHAIEKGKQAIHARLVEGDNARPAGPIAGMLASIPAVKKIQEETHAVKEMAGKVKAAEQGVQKGVEKIADTGEKVVDALKNAGGKATDAVGGGVAHLAEAWHGRQQANEEAHRERLIVAAGTAGVQVDESWPIARLEAELNRAEDIAWHHRWNARCPHAKCHKPLRLNPSTPAWKTGNCIYCGQRFYLRAAVNLGPPPRPRSRY